MRSSGRYHDGYFIDQCIFDVRMTIIVDVQNRRDTQCFSMATFWESSDHLVIFVLRATVGTFGTLDSVHNTTDEIQQVIGSCTHELCLRITLKMYVRIEKC